MQGWIADSIKEATMRTFLSNPNCVSESPLLVMPYTQRCPVVCLCEQFRVQLSADFDIMHAIEVAKGFPVILAVGACWSPPLTD
jgi:hypothetical protein